MKRWVVVLVAAVLGLVLLFAVADFATRRAAERAVAEEIKRSSDARSVEVSLGGALMLLNIARGRVPSALVQIRGAVRNGFEFERVDLTLRDLRFRRTMAVGGNVEVEGAGGTARISFSVDELNNLLGPARGTVEFSPTGDGVEAMVDVPFVGEVRVGVNVDVENGALVVGLDNVSVEGAGVQLPVLPKLRVRLPALPSTTDLVGMSASKGNLILDLRFGEFSVDSRGNVSAPTRFGLASVPA